MFRKIMIAVDVEHEQFSEKAVQVALEIGGQTENVVYQMIAVIPPVGTGFVSSFLPKDYDKKLAEKAKAALKTFTKKHFPEGVQVKHIVAMGTIYEEINRIAREQNSELVIVASSKPNTKGLGPNAARVARYCDKPVLIIR